MLGKNKIAIMILDIVENAILKIIINKIIQFKFYNNKFER